MDTDDLEPPAKKTAPKDLEVMSVGALNGYIAELQGEITRVRDAIARKLSARHGAERFFK